MRGLRAGPWPRRRSTRCTGNGREITKLTAPPPPRCHWAARFGATRVQFIVHCGSWTSPDFEYPSERPHWHTSRRPLNNSTDHLQRRSTSAPCRSESVDELLVAGTLIALINLPLLLDESSASHTSVRVLCRRQLRRRPDVASRAGAPRARLVVCAATASVRTHGDLWGLARAAARGRGRTRRTRLTRSRQEGVSVLGYF